MGDDDLTINDYSEHFSHIGFWKKVKDHAAAAGKEIIFYALVLYYALKDDEMPTWARTVMVSALGYFILPTDAIPDIIPAVGYADDLGVLLAALSMVAVHIKPEHKAAARSKLKEWFGDDGDKGGNTDDDNDDDGASAAALVP